MFTRFVVVGDAENGFGTPSLFSEVTRLVETTACATMAEYALQNIRVLSLYLDPATPFLYKRLAVLNSKNVLVCCVRRPEIYTRAPLKRNGRRCYQQF
jgi:hypothetical protein